MSSILVPDWNREQTGQRWRVNFSQTPDALSFLATRDKEFGHFWIHLKGGISPVIPLLLGLARVDEGWPSVEEMPLVVHPDPEHWELCIKQWVIEGGCDKAREKLRVKTGRSRWLKPSDVDAALVMAPSELVVPLKLFKRDAWVWSCAERYST